MQLKTLLDSQVDAGFFSPTFYWRQII